MPETEHTQENVAAIATRLDNLERLTRLSIASNPNSAAHIQGVFRARNGSAKLYLFLADGPKSPKALEILMGKSQASTSKICNYLFEEGLIERMKDPKNAKSILLAYWPAIQTVTNTGITT